jgi:hypothetical protein
MSYTYFGSQLGGDDKKKEFNKKLRRRNMIEWITSPISSAKRAILEKTDTIASQEEIMRKVIREVLIEEGLITVDKKKKKEPAPKKRRSMHSPIFRAVIRRPDEE